MLQTQFTFEQCRRDLSAPLRSTLDQLTQKLSSKVPRGLPPQNTMANFTTAIQRAMHGLTDEECQALAFYVLCDIASKGSQSDSLQFAKLQNSMESENRQFTMVANMMKTKHDTVKNTISNIH